MCFFASANADLTVKCIREIGVMRIIEVVDYQDSWTKNFEDESQLLNDAISVLNPTIHHIGSTAVQGLAAKPIIDILIEVENVIDLDSYNSEMKAAGYYGRGELGIPGRRFFQKGGDNRSHQVHAFKTGHFDVIRHLAFRDYLINHSEIALQYAALKRHVAIESNNDIDRYCEGKNEFVQKHEKQAVEWYSFNKSSKKDALMRASS